MAGNPPGIRLNPRTKMVAQAGAEMHDWLIRIQEDKQLTTIELLQIMNECEHMLIRRVLRVERHPDDPDRKADEL